MIIRTALLAATLTLTTGAIAQNHPGGITGPGQVMPDSRDARTVDEHLNHGVPTYHHGLKCRIYVRHGQHYRRCTRRH